MLLQSLLLSLQAFDKLRTLMRDKSCGRNTEHKTLEVKTVDEKGNDEQIGTNNDQ